MLKETIKYEDYNGQTREEVVYFHLTEKEIVDLQAHSEHGIQYDMDEAIKSNNAGRALDFITNLVDLAYGVKTQDGKRHIKTPELLLEFKTSAYYSDFLMGLIQDNGAKGQEFIQGIMPKKLVDRALAQAQGQDGGPADRTIHESTVYAPSARETFEQRTQQPTPPSQFQPSSTQAPIPSSPPADPEYQAYLQWKEQQKHQQNTAELGRTEQPEQSYRVPAEEPVEGLSRPVHEQNDANPQ